MEDLPIVQAVQDLLDDQDRFGPINDGVNWFVTESWRDAFLEHLQILRRIAENGDAMAQCQIGNLYYCGYFYTSEEQFVANYDEDISEATKWWLKALEGGVYSVLDVLMVSGVGKEADFIRKTFSENRSVFTNEPAPTAGWESDMKKLYELIQ